MFLEPIYKPTCETRPSSSYSRTDGEAPGYDRLKDLSQLLDGGKREEGSVRRTSEGTLRVTQGRTTVSGDGISAAGLLKL